MYTESNIETLSNTILKESSIARSTFNVLTPTIDYKALHSYNSALVEPSQGVLDRTVEAIMRFIENIVKKMNNLWFNRAKFVKNNERIIVNGYDKMMGDRDVVVRLEPINVVNRKYIKDLRNLRNRILKQVDRKFIVGHNLPRNFNSVSVRRIEFMDIMTRINEYPLSIEPQDWIDFIDHIKRFYRSDLENIENGKKEIMLRYKYIRHEVETGERTILALPKAKQPTVDKTVTLIRSKLSLIMDIYNAELEALEHMYLAMYRALRIFYDYGK